ncbi:single-stranded-DNA-specific exonuclease RecJ [Bacteroidota bacterium]
MKKRWILKEMGEMKAIQKLSAALSIDDNLSNLLIQRDVTSFDEAKSYFRPELNQLHDPFLMKDMDKAIDRLEEAVANKEKILVYGDYDVDGTTAVALVYTFLKTFYEDVDFYIPDRYSEGYGISYKGIDYANEQGFSLIIVLDCGIKAIEKVEYAKQFNIDFIICDHHRPGAELPNASAVLDPKRADCTYPYKELSGCGVGFKFIQGYAQQKKFPFDELIPFLDLVVVSIAADIVPITGENRILAFFGLKVLNSKPRAGLEAIFRCANIIRLHIPKGNYHFSREISISDLVFLVGPRINAAGRIENAKESVELLIASEDKYASQLADQVNNLNIERKNLDLNATQEALERMSSDSSTSNNKSTVLYDPTWHKGVIGIVASRLTEHYYKPTVVLTQSHGLITGSARSVKDFDIYDAIDSCNELLEHFGGHKYAAGLSLKPENFEAFRDKFEAYVKENMKDSMTIPVVEIDLKIILKDINSKFFRVLKQFAPFGPGNMAPIFQTDRIIDTGKARIVGKNHLKLEVVHPDISGFPFSAIAFQQGEHLERIKAGEEFKICYHIEENEWNGVKYLQLNIKDIMFND